MNGAERERERECASRMNEPANVRTDQKGASLRGGRRESAGLVPRAKSRVSRGGRGAEAEKIGEEPRGKRERRKKRGKSENKGERGEERPARQVRRRHLLPESLSSSHSRETTPQRRDATILFRAHSVRRERSETACRSYGCRNRNKSARSVKSARERKKSGESGAAGCKGVRCSSSVKRFRRSFVLFSTAVRDVRVYQVSFVRTNGRKVIFGKKKKIIVRWCARRSRE